MISIKKVLKCDETLCLILVLCYGFFSHLYVISRYGGLVADNDVSTYKGLIQNLQVYQGVEGFIQSHSFGFQIITTEISDITGLTISQVQILPFGFFYLIIAYLLFREFTDNKYTAFIGAAILSLLPDLLFITARGTHERYTFFLFLLSIFILVRYSKNSLSFQKSAKYLAILYFSLLTMGIVNQWFFVLILTVIITTLVLGLLQSLVFKTDGDSYKKMLFSIIPIIPLSYCLVQYGTSSNTMFMWIISTWIGKVFGVLPHVQVLPLLGGAIIMILMLFAIHKTGSHIILQQGINAQIDNLKKNIFFSGKFQIVALLVFLVWIAFVYYFIAPSTQSFHSPTIYLFLTGIYWIILPISGIMALIIVKRYVIDKKSEYTHKNLGTLFIVSFFGLFCLSVFIDRVIHSGIGDNLEFRVFPYLLVLLVFGAACALSEISTMIIKPPWKKIFVVLIIVGFVVFSISSLLKATNDPSVAVFKIHYTIEEKNGFNWIEKNYHQSSIWFGEGRLFTAFKFESSDNSYNNARAAPEGTANMFIVTQDYMRESVNFDSHAKVYDNAEIMIFRAL